MDRQIISGHIRLLLSSPLSSENNIWREARALSSPKSAVNRTNLGDKRHWQCRKSVFMDTWKQEKTGRHILRHFNYRLVALGNDKEIWGSYWVQVFSSFRTYKSSFQMTRLSEILVPPCWISLLRISILIPL